MVQRLFVILRRGIYRISYFAVWVISLVTLVTLWSTIADGLIEVMPFQEWISRAMLVPLALASSVGGSFWMANRWIRKS